MAKAKVEPATSTKEDPILTIKEAAAQLGIHPSTLSRWCSAAEDQSIPEDRKRPVLMHMRHPSGRPKIRQSIVNVLLQATRKGYAAVEEMQYEDQEK